MMNNALSLLSMGRQSSFALRESFDSPSTHGRFNIHDTGAGYVRVWSRDSYISFPRGQDNPV